MTLGPINDVVDALRRLVELTDRDHEAWQAAREALRVWDTQPIHCICCGSLNTYKPLDEDITFCKACSCQWMESRRGDEEARFLERLRKYLPGAQ